VTIERGERKKKTANIAVSRQATKIHSVPMLDEDKSKPKSAVDSMHEDKSSRQSSMLHAAIARRQSAMIAALSRPVAAIHEVISKPQSPQAGANKMQSTFQSTTSTRQSAMNTTTSTRKSAMQAANSARQSAMRATTGSAMHTNPLIRRSALQMEIDRRRSAMRTSMKDDVSRDPKRKIRQSVTTIPEGSRPDKQSIAQLYVSMPDRDWKKDLKCLRDRNKLTADLWGGQWSDSLLSESKSMSHVDALGSDSNNMDIQKSFFDLESYVFFEEWDLGIQFNYGLGDRRQRPTVRDIASDLDPFVVKGICRGDVLTHIQDTDTLDMTIDQIQHLLDYKRPLYLTFAKIDLRMTFSMIHPPRRFSEQPRYTGFPAEFTVQNLDLKFPPRAEKLNSTWTPDPKKSGGLNDSTFLTSKLDLASSQPPSLFEKAKNATTLMLQPAFEYPRIDPFKTIGEGKIWGVLKEDNKETFDKQWLGRKTLENLNKIGTEQAKEGAGAGAGAAGGRFDATGGSSPASRRESSDEKDDRETTSKLDSFWDKEDEWKWDTHWEKKYNADVENNKNRETRISVRRRSSGGKQEDDSTFMEEEGRRTRTFMTAMHQTFPRGYRMTKKDLLKEARIHAETLRRRAIWKEPLPEYLRDVRTPRS